MELYDERISQKKSKIPTVIGICIVILVLITILIFCGIIYLKNSIVIIEIDGEKNTELEKILYVESTETGTELYIPIIQMANYLNYEGFNGDYKNKSEDKTKCHVTSEDEIAMFTKDSNIIVKVNENETEYVEIDKPVFEKDGELYTTKYGIEKAFNVMFLSDDKLKNISIFSMDYLVEFYADTLKIENYAEMFADKKAILEGMLIIEENGKYGVKNAYTKESILETKYESISYLPTTTDFLVKNNGKFGIVTKDTTIKIKPVYDEIRIMDNQEGLYLVKQNNVYGVVNGNGDVIIQPEHKQIGINIGKYVQNGVDNKYILLNELIPIQNQDGLWGFFDVSGKKVTDFKYTDIGCKETPVVNSYPALIIPSHKIVVVEVDKYYNLLTFEGEELIEGNVLNSVYFKIDTTTEQNQFFMTSIDNTKIINVGEWLTSIGR